MKQLLLFVFFISSLAAGAQTIEPRPVPPRLVNDFAGVLTADQRQALESKLVAYDDSTSNQIALITINTTNGYDIQQVALKYLREWGVGNKKTNNGIVILAAITDHTLRIETGYGLEGALPDLLAKTIIETEILPGFRAGNYYRGFNEGTDAIIQAIAGEYKAPAGYNKKDPRGGGVIGFVVLIIIILLISLFSGGGRGGGMMSRGGFGPFILGTLLGSMDRGGSGGFGGGGFGGGGFGGFGGGSGGGGGASGRW